ncbi:hypothetical protein PROFUN_02374 [Planoprotostelium fungivorum]|uniref:Uncharacterized protein n=1 Tax=Planoprotostelium fungivorum TaxID=1890364 RepID=A0A2P6NUN1_9EUKA|nr:hypothetical protein PROFUN_02374 [Planoprotostelium fungivorum]
MDWERAVERLGRRETNRNQGRPTIVVERHTPVKQVHRRNEDIAQEEDVEVSHDLLNSLQELERLKSRRDELEKLQRTLNEYRGLASELQALQNQRPAQIESSSKRVMGGFEPKPDHPIKIMNRGGDHSRNHQPTPEDRNRPPFEGYAGQKKKTADKRATDEHNILELLKALQEEAALIQPPVPQYRDVDNYVDYDEPSRPNIVVRNNSKNVQYDLGSDEITESEGSEEEGQRRYHRNPPKQNQQPRGQALPHGKGKKKRKEERQDIQKKNNQQKNKRQSPNQEASKRNESRYPSSVEEEEENNRNSGSYNEDLKAILSYMRMQTEQISTIQTELRQLKSDVARSSEQTSAPKNQNRNASLNPAKPNLQRNDSSSGSESEIEEFSDSEYRAWKKEGKLQFINNVQVRGDQPSYPYTQVSLGVSDDREDTDQMRLSERYRLQLRKAQQEASSLGVDSRQNRSPAAPKHFSPRYIEESSDEGDKASQDMVDPDSEVKHLHFPEIQLEKEDDSEVEEALDGLSPEYVSQLTKEEKQKYVRFAQQVKEEEAGEQIVTEEDTVGLTDVIGGGDSDHVISEPEEFLNFLGSEIASAFSPFLLHPSDGLFLLNALQLLQKIKSHDLEDEFMRHFEQWTKERTTRSTAEQSTEESTLTRGGAVTDVNAEENRQEEEEEATELSSEYTDEFFAKQIITKRLDLLILDFLEGNPSRKFTSENLKTMEKYTIESITNRTQLMDDELAESIHIMIHSYLDKDIQVYKENLISSVSDLLYDEMIFSKVIQKVDRSYLEEIKDLQTEEGILLKQRQDDIIKLKQERNQRLSSIQEPLVKTAPIDSTPDIAKTAESLLELASQSQGRPLLTSAFAKYFTNPRHFDTSSVGSADEAMSTGAISGSPAVELASPAITSENPETTNTNIDEKTFAAAVAGFGFSPEQLRHLREQFVKEQEDLNRMSDPTDPAQDLPPDQVTPTPDQTQPHPDVPTQNEDKFIEAIISDDTIAQTAPGEEEKVIENGIVNFTEKQRRREDSIRAQLVFPFPVCIFRDIHTLEGFSRRRRPKALELPLLKIRHSRHDRMNTRETQDITFPTDTPPQVGRKRKSSNHRLPKHIINARHLEKKRRRQTTYSAIDSWVEGGKLEHRLLREYFDCIKDLVGLMGYRYKKHLLLPTLIYTDRFIKREGSIPASSLFRLLLTSAMVTIKFWEDWGIDSAIVSEVTNIPKDDLSAWERRFLAAIDYSLFISDEHVERFQAAHSKIAGDSA